MLLGKVHIPSSLWNFWFVFASSAFSCECGHAAADLCHSRPPHDTPCTCRRMSPSANRHRMTWNHRAIHLAYCWCSHRRDDEGHWSVVDSKATTNRDCWQCRRCCFANSQQIDRYRNLRICEERNGSDEKNFVCQWREKKIVRRNQNKCRSNLHINDDYSRQNVVDLRLNLYLDGLLSHVHHGGVNSVDSSFVIDLFDNFPSLPSYLPFLTLEGVKLRDRCDEIWSWESRSSKPQNKSCDVFAFLINRSDHSGSLRNCRVESRVELK